MEEPRRRPEMPQPVSDRAEPRVEVATGPEFGDYWGG